MFSGHEFGGITGDIKVGVQGHPAIAREPSAETIPFEHRLMTKREMADYFGITERTIEVWMHRRYIPYTKIGKSVRFRVGTVMRYIDDKYLVSAGEPRRRGRNQRTTVVGDETESSFAGH